jgi:hypothetical protein
LIPSYFTFFTAGFFATAFFAGAGAAPGQLPGKPLVGTFLPSDGQYVSGTTVPVSTLLLGVVEDAPGQFPGKPLVGTLRPNEGQ